MNEHPLKTEIYKKGYTIKSFADVIGINRLTLNCIFKHRNKSVRGDTIYRISEGLNIPYESVERLCQ